MASRFDAVMDHLLREEGGFQNDPRDAGNWTGGAVGAGERRGTKFGISAAAYPMLDIVRVTEEVARALYEDDYWRVIRGGDLPAGLDLAVMDFAVHSGPARAARTLQRVVGAGVDGIIGPRTLAATGRAWIGLGAADLLAQYGARRGAFLESLGPTPWWGWRVRLLRVHAQAVADATGG